MDEKRTNDNHSNIKIDQKKINEITNMVLYVVLSIISVIGLIIFNDNEIATKVLTILVIFFVIMFYSSTFKNICEYFYKQPNKLKGIIITCIILLFGFIYFYIDQTYTLSMDTIGYILLALIAFIIIGPFLYNLLTGKYSIENVFKTIVLIGLSVFVIFFSREILNNESMAALYKFLGGSAVAGIVIFLTLKFGLLNKLGDFALAIYSTFICIWSTMFIPDLTTYLFSSFVSNNLVNFMNNFMTLLIINLTIVVNFLYYVQDPFTILKLLIIIVSIGIFSLGMAMYWAPDLCAIDETISYETGWSTSKIIGITLFVLSLFLVRNIYKSIQYVNINNGLASNIRSTPLWLTDIIYAIIIYGSMFITTELTWEKINLKKNLGESFWLRFSYSFLILFVGSMIDYKISYSDRDSLRKKIERAIVWLIVITFFLYSIFKMGYLESVEETEKDLLNTLKNPDMMKVKSIL